MKRSVKETSKAQPEDGCEDLIPFRGQTTPLGSITIVLMLCLLRFFLKRRFLHSLSASKWSKIMLDLMIKLSITRGLIPDQFVVKVDLSTLCAHTRDSFHFSSHLLDVSIQQCYQFNNANMTCLLNIFFS